MAVLAAIFNLHVTSTRLMRDARNFERASTILLSNSDLMQVLDSAKIKTFVAGAGLLFDQDGRPLKDGTDGAFYTLSGSLLPLKGTFQRLTMVLTWQQNRQTRELTSDLMVNLP